MSRGKTFLMFAVAAAAGCTEDIQKPAENPPAPWGVPITGGTMIITRDGGHAVIADPDRDRVVSVDLATRKVIAEVALEPNDEPGRLVEDAAGRIHIALRRGGAIVTLSDATSAALASRRPVCAEPRGLAWDGATDLLHVACTSGELVSLPAAGGEVTRRLRLDRDLRDVVIAGNQLVVTRFRTAELLTIDAQGVVVSRALPPTVRRFAGFNGGGAEPQPEGDGRVDAVPTVAWRAIGLADGSIVMTHQRQLKTTLQTEQPGGYGGGCGQGAVEAAVTVVRPGQAPFAVKPIAGGALPVDIAINAANDTLAVVVAGNQTVHLAHASSLGMEDKDDDCGGDDPSDDAAPTINDQLGAPTSVAFAPNGDLAIYYPELPALVVHSGDKARTIQLTGELGYDAGRGLFHAQTAVGLACASCHPEGREDGLVWDFGVLGTRRTQSLGGHILQRAPYHWAGDMTDLPKLMDDVFAKRMAGGELTRSQKLSLGPWLDRIPAPAAVAPVDPAPAERGKALFESADVGCVGCHGGAILTTNLRVNVGTNGTFKVPSLAGVAARPPFMHDGCAITLHDRFGACGGGDTHGHTSQLTPVQIDDLVAYLESL